MKTFTKKPRTRWGHGEPVWAPPRTPRPRGSEEQRGLHVGSLWGPTSHTCVSSPSLSASTLSMSSGSSLGSLASSRGSLNTSSRGSLNSLSSSELYYTSQGDQMDSDYQYKLDFLLQEKGGYIPSGPITTIHENEVVKSPSQPGQSGPCRAAVAAAGHAPPLTEAPKSVTSLSSRSSLSSLSPPGSPLVLEGTFPMSPHDVPLHQFAADFDDCELSGHFADMGLGENQILLDPDSGGASQSPLEDKDLHECAKEPFYEGAAGKGGRRWPVSRLAVSGDGRRAAFSMNRRCWSPFSSCCSLCSDSSEEFLSDVPRHFSFIKEESPSPALCNHSAPGLPRGRPLHGSARERAVDTLRTFTRSLVLEEQGRERGLLFKVGPKQMKAKAISVPAN